MNPCKPFNKNTGQIIGLMSGTSLDGLDIALVEISGNGLQTAFTLKAFRTSPYSSQIQRFILDCAAPARGSTACVSQLNFFLANVWSEAVLEFLENNHLKPGAVDFIGSHGQTVYHQPAPSDFAGRPTASTLQVGDPAVLAKKTGIPVVGNFRDGDMALGGEGAPLVPYVDYLLLRSEEKNRAILNLGGIANVTVIPRKARKEEVFAFDTGPGNMVMDALARDRFHRRYDENGAIAGKGRVHETLLRRLLEEPYFRQLPPKSTGRKLFGETFVQRLLRQQEKLKVPDEDLMATAAQLTVLSIVNAAKEWIEPKVSIDEWIVSGGGAHNPVLLKGLAQHLEPARVLLSEEYGLPVDAKEAIAFAVLANEMMNHNPANLPSVTGAERETILGTLSFP
ncbi:anhydro-N-acetylmuramic acid kinase [bacterium BMS3Bbin03]|nr:anhydro-N-acetylmuramic acid kinase [bacterium BMS3Bbin03]